MEYDVRNLVETADKPKRRWFQYRLRGLFLLSVVVALLLGFCLYWDDWRKHRPPYQDYDFDGCKSACEKFVADLKASRLDHAYESTSRRFKKQMSGSQFRTLIRKFPLIRNWPESQAVTYTFRGPEPDGPDFLSSWSEFHFTRQEWLANSSTELWVWIVMDDSFFYRRPPMPKVEEILIREVDWPISSSIHPLPSWKQESTP